MCLAARQHTGGTSVSPLLLRRSWTMTCAPRRHSTIVRSPHNWERDTCRFRIRLKTVGFRELLLPFADVLGCPRLDSLIRLERNVRPRVFPRHPPTTSGATFTLGVLFPRESAMVPFGPVHYHYPVKNIYFTAYVFPSAASYDV